jgi:hypothetical protein
MSRRIAHKRATFSSSPIRNRNNTELGDVQRGTRVGEQRESARTDHDGGRQVAEDRTEP